MDSSLTSLYKPTHQLVFFECDSKSYVEHYEVETTEDGKSRLSEGKPLTKRALKKLLEHVAASGKNPMGNMGKLMPPNIIYFDPRPSSTKLIWFNPAQERLLTGIYKNPTLAKLPAMLYMLEDGTLNIYCIKSGNKRPDVKTALFHAPLPNVYEDCNVCMGSVATPKNYSEISDLINGWEHAFWGSKFTDHLWNKGFDKILRASMRSKQPFPTKDLKPLKKTIANLIK